MKKNLYISFLLLTSLLMSLLAPVKVYATEASLRCSPTTGTYNIGDTFVIDYVLDSRGFEVYGADIEATIDTQVFEPVGTQSIAVTTDTGWSQPSTNTIDTTGGLITLDYGNSQPVYAGSATVGQLTVRALASGQAQFSFKFTQPYDNTTPGVAKVWGKKDGVNLSNILTDVNNCIFIVADAESPTATTAPNPTVPPDVTSPPEATELPRSGVVENTLVFMGLGALLLAVGSIIPAISYSLKKN